MFANNLSVNPFTIDPSKAVYTLTFVCVLLFILLVGCTYMYQLQIRDYREFEEEFVINYRSSNNAVQFNYIFVFVSVYSQLFIPNND